MLEEFGEILKWFQGEIEKFWKKFKKKSLAQEVRQKSDISERRRNKGWAPFNPYFVCN